VNFIDTAMPTGPVVSETLIGEALSPYAKGIVIATKGGLHPAGTGQVASGWASGVPRQQVEMSLRYLKLETIDLWQLQPHRSEDTSGRVAGRDRQTPAGGQRSATSASLK